MRKKHRGFSLVELIIVVAVMAAIATVIVPSISGATDAARRERAQAAADALSLAQVRYRLENGLDNYGATAEERYVQLRNYLEYSEHATLAAFETAYGYNFNIPAASGGAMQRVTVGAKITTP